MGAARAEIRCPQHGGWARTAWPHVRRDDECGVPVRRCWLALHRRHLIDAPAPARPVADLFFDEPAPAHGPGITTPGRTGEDPDHGRCVQPTGLFRCDSGSLYRLQRYIVQVFERQARTLQRQPDYAIADFATGEFAPRRGGTAFKVIDVKLHDGRRPATGLRGERHQTRPGRDPPDCCWRPCSPSAM